MRPQSALAGVVIALALAGLGGFFIGIGLKDVGLVVAYAAALVFSMIAVVTPIYIWVEVRKLREGLLEPDREETTSRPDTAEHQGRRDVGAILAARRGPARPS